MPHPQFDQIPRNLDYSSLETKIMGKLLHDGVAITQLSVAQSRRFGKQITYMMVDDFLKQLHPKGKRSLRNRHHKRKGQPNAGPRKQNSW